MNSRRDKSSEELRNETMLQGQAPCSVYSEGPSSGTNPLKYSYDTNMQSLWRLSANLVRRSVGVVSNGSQIIAIA